MVTFKESSFVVEVPTFGNPTEDWLRTINDMIEIMQCEEEQMKQRRHNYLELIKHLMPDWETAQKMTVK